MTAPWIIDGAIDREAFDTYVETQLAPALGKGDVVILDNLSVHVSARAEAALRSRGSWMLFLPQYSPDLNPIEMAFSKLKAHLRKAAARSFDDLASCRLASWRCRLAPARIIGCGKWRDKAMRSG